MDKKEKQLKFSLIEPEEYEIPELVETSAGGKDYINYGLDNNYPEYLWNLYLKSALTASIINGTADFVIGEGVILNESLTKYNIVNKDKESFEDVIKKCVFDYLIFGGFAIQILRDSNKEISELYHIDIRYLRKNADENKIYYSNKWGRWGAKSIIYDEYDINKKQPSSIYYFKGHITRGVYPIPRYNGAINSIETSCRIGEFHLSNIINNFEPSVIVNFNNGEPSQEEKKNIEKRLTEKFSGPRKAGSFMCVFNENKEQAADIQRLSEDSLDKKFEILTESVRKEIFIAFRATPALFGLNPENNGFSKEEFKEAFTLYNRTVVAPIQSDFIRVFNSIFNMSDSIEFTPFKLNDEE